MDDEELTEKDRPAIVVAVKPALKPPTTSDAATKNTKKKTTTLQWDEAKIAEHNVLRGTRMKIDEPDTPFHYDEAAEETEPDEDADDQHHHPESWHTTSEHTATATTPRTSTSNSSTSNTMTNTAGTALNLELLTHKLEVYEAVKEHVESTTRPDNREEAADRTHQADHERQRQELKKLEFAERRKRHYNEFEAVRRLRALQQEEDDDDEDDDDEDDEE